MNKKLLKILGPSTEEDFTSLLLKTYKDLFDLNTIESHEKVDKQFMAYCLKGKYFLEVVAYNSNREIFVQRDLVSNRSYWELAGGWVKEGESFEQALDRIVAKEIGDIVVETKPVALLNNHYTDGQSKTTHRGILYVARVLQDKSQHEDGVFTKNPAKYLEGKDKKLVKICQRLVSKMVFEPPVEEVESFDNSKIAYKIHSLLIKPISFLGSSVILQGNILKHIKNTDRFIVDVACGDDKLILKTVKEGRVCVANDITRKSLTGLFSFEYKGGVLVFSNQNAINLKFDKKFDVAIVKNTLHHFRNPEELDSFLSNARRLAKRVIILDIEDPKKNFLARAWNSYYRHFLKDQGGFFLDFEKFKKIICLYFGSKNCSFTRVQTIKGPYILAVAKNDYEN